MSGSVESTISEVAARLGINRNALSRLIYNESRGNPFVGMSRDNYTAGIGQISRAVWQKYSKIPYEEASKPQFYKNNIFIAALYLKENYIRFGNWTDALAAYNVGANALIQIKKGQRKMPTITKNYIKNFKG